MTLPSRHPDTPELVATPWDVFVVALPLRRPFRGIAVREAVLLRGPGGWGEFAPFREYTDAEAVPWWRSAHESATGVDLAQVRSQVPVNATVPAVVAADVAAVMASFPGCSTAKVKVVDPGGVVDDDLSRLSAVREVLGPRGRIRIDVNGAWDVDTALSLLPRYDRAAGGLEYVEQPCADVADLATVRRRLSVLVAADESLRRSADPLAVARREAADVAVVKVAPLGGLAASYRLAAALSSGWGIPTVVSSALDTPVGLSAGIHLAAALPELPYACGLATSALFIDGAGGPVASVGVGSGSVAVAASTPEQAWLSRWAAPHDTQQWWRERLRRVATLATEPPR